MSFLQAEKRRQTEWKLKTCYLTREAKHPGLFANRLRPFALPVDHAYENLFSETRNSILEYFRSQHIIWHAGAIPGLPSNHLCSSQVLVVNFFAPFRHEPQAIADLLRPAIPDIQEILPIESPGQYIAFEWIPPIDVQGPSASKFRHHRLLRGIGNTSIDCNYSGRFLTK